MLKVYEGKENIFSGKKVSINQFLPNRSSLAFLLFVIECFLPQESKILAVFKGGYFISIRLLIPETAVI